MSEKLAYVCWIAIVIIVFSISSCVKTCNTNEHMTYRANIEVKKMELQLKLYQAGR